MASVEMLDEGRAHLSVQPCGQRTSGTSVNYMQGSSESMKTFQQIIRLITQTDNIDLQIIQDLMPPLGHSGSVDR
jgi:hypothetical protein